MTSRRISSAAVAGESGSSSDLQDTQLDRLEAACAGRKQLQLGSAGHTVGPAGGGLRRPLPCEVIGPRLRLGHPRPPARRCGYEHPTLPERSKGWRCQAPLVAPLLDRGGRGLRRVAAGRRRAVATPSGPPGRPRSLSCLPCPSVPCGGQCGARAPRRPGWFLLEECRPVDWVGLVAGYAVVADHRGGEVTGRGGDGLWKRSGQESVDFN